MGGGGGKGEYKNQLSVKISAICLFMTVNNQRYEPKFS